MKLEFDLENITSTEFGVGLGTAGNPVYRKVAPDGEVQDALVEMVTMTWKSMQKSDAGPSEFEFSEKYESTEYLTVSVNEDYVKRLKMLHELHFVTPDAFALHHSENIFCYFARLIDKNNCNLTALRTASQFKSVSNGRALYLRDELRIFKDPIFKLDRDFDILIDLKHIHIWRPNAFVTLGALKQEVLRAVPTNIALLQTAIPFVDFDNIQIYSQGHIRAARYLASIRKQNLDGIDSLELQKLCERAQISLQVSNGIVRVDDQNIPKFLQALDRRIYVDELDPSKPESYVAASREKL